MACELLLLGREPEGLPLLLIEEPEAHLHPQRQLRLMEFLQSAATGMVGNPDRSVQVIVTTHSPNLASKIPLSNMVLLESQLAFPLQQGQTMLETGDYRFLQRFLDVTKANLFFAHGVCIVEGDAEAILIPTLAKLIGRDFTLHGVSIVNVGGTGLRRFSRILQRRDSGHGTLKIPVASITDLDVMPDCAPLILGLVQSEDDPKWQSPRRRWRAMRHLGGTTEEQHSALESLRNKLCRDDGQTVKTFPADHWTLEYDLAFCGLAEEVHLAALLAKNDDPLWEEKKSLSEIEIQARFEFEKLHEELGENNEALCSSIYRAFKTEGASKATAAQFLAEIITKMIKVRFITGENLREMLPKYLVNAIDYATGKASIVDPPLINEPALAEAVEANA